MSAPATTLQGLPLYGRKYKLQIKFPPNDNGEQTVLTVADSDAQSPSLRITFDVFTPGWQSFWYADICIYNLDQATTEQILGDGTKGPSGIKQGMEVILSAGYQNGGSYGVIFAGNVLQPLFDRENVTDFKITLHCIIGLDGYSRNFINATYPASITQQQLVANMARDCFHPVQASASTISSNLSQKQLSRGKSVFGNPAKYFSAIAQDNNMLTWLGSRGLNIADIKSEKDVEISTADVPVFTPTTGIIGTPQQTQYGANIRLLLDSRVSVQKPFKQIKIDNAVIRRQKAAINVPMGLLDQDGMYIVLATRYLGDTRGQDWYVDVTGITSLNGKLAILQVIGASLQQGGSV